MSNEPLSDSAGMESDEKFAEMYQAYQPRIYRFLFWRTQDAATADDLTSGVFERAWRARASFQGGSVQAWLYRIAHNLLTDHWRKRQAVPLGEADELVADDAISVAEQLDSAQA